MNHPVFPRPRHMIPMVLLSLAIILSIPSCSAPGYVVKQQPDEQIVVMLSIDGCRWDYPQMVDMPNLSRIARKGVKAASLQSVFPSKTFPNHYALATGLYADHHGIVQNSFYDPEMEAAYRISDRAAVENGAFYSGEPIWVTAEKQGLRTASYFWVGSEAPIQGIQPANWKRYEHNFPFESRIDSVIAWLELPAAKRPRLITWYMHEPDGVGHRYGPESEETHRTLVYLDSLVGVFLDRVEALPIADRINVIVTSDHGMTALSPQRVLVLDDYIQRDWLARIEGGSPVLLLDVKDEFADTTLAALQNIPHLQAWWRETLPDTLHYGMNPRVLDLVVTCDLGWSLLWRDQLEKDGYLAGTHGYDPRYRDMHAIFYAQGPAFKEGFVHPTFENVHVYSLIAHLLDLQPAPTDGNLEAVQAMLRRH